MEDSKRLSFFGGPFSMLFVRVLCRGQTPDKKGKQGDSLLLPVFHLQVAPRGFPSYNGPLSKKGHLFPFSKWVMPLSWAGDESAITLAGDAMNNACAEKIAST